MKTHVSAVTLNHWLIQYQKCFITLTTLLNVNLFILKTEWYCHHDDRTSWFGFNGGNKRGRVLDNYLFIEILYVRYKKDFLRLVQVLLLVIALKDLSSTVQIYGVFRLTDSRLFGPGDIPFYIIIKWATETNTRRESREFLELKSCSNQVWTKKYLIHTVWLNYPDEDENEIRDFRWLFPTAIGF